MNTQRTPTPVGDDARSVVSRAKITDPGEGLDAEAASKARTEAEDAAAPASPARVGRPPLPPEKVQRKLIRERVTDAQLAEYQARGGKAWLVRELGRKARA